MSPSPRKDAGPSPLTDTDLHLFNEGTHCRLYRSLGAHPAAAGTHFGVWAPNAASVSVVGDFNAWEPGRSPLTPRGASGLWEGFVSRSSLMVWPRAASRMSRGISSISSQRSRTGWGERAARAEAGMMVRIAPVHGKVVVVRVG